jgi:hypothetical protein
LRENFFKYKGSKQNHKIERDKPFFLKALSTPDIHRASLFGKKEKMEVAIMSEKRVKLKYRLFLT